MSSSNQIDMEYICSTCYGTLNVNAVFNDITNDLTVYMSPCENCSPEGRTKKQDELTQLRKNFATYLVPLYKKDPEQIAELCDVTLDRTGALLGFVRDAARPKEG